MTDTFTIGIDFGTESGRAVVVRVRDGAELASAVTPYPDGVIDQTLPGTSTRWATSGRCRTRSTTCTC